MNNFRMGPATKAILLITAVLSIVAQLTTARLNLMEHVVYDVPSIVQSFQLWRIVTGPFFYHTGRGLIFGLIWFFFMAVWFENTYGTRDFLRFFAWSLVGAGVIAIPLHYLIDASHILQDMTIGAGLEPAADAILMAMALNNPNSNILLGFVLPIRIRTFVIGMLVFRLVVGILDDGYAMMSLTLAGLAMGYLLVTGKWRPASWAGKTFKRRNSPRVRSGLYIVPPKHDDTLH